MSRMKISRKMLRNQSYYLRVDDVCYFGSLDHWSECAFKSLDLTWRPWMEQVFGASNTTGPLKEPLNILLFANIQSKYELFRMKNGVEPPWIRELPKRNREFLRWRYLQNAEDLEPLAIILSKAFAGFGYIVEEGGLTERIINAFGLYRLKHIKQLGYLHHPIIRAQGGNVAVNEFRHSRFLHVLDVRAVAKLILANNGRNDEERILSDIATLTHDALTPAGGDSIKWIDQKVFDEDLHYPELMRRTDWRLLPEAPPNAAEVLPQIIINRGLLGQVLDIADKIAYVGIDLESFYIKGPPRMEGRDLIAELLEQQSEPSSLWECVRIENNEMYFDDKARLVNFLALRAVLFSKLYTHPASRFWEMFVKTFVQKRFYEPGRLTRDHLIQMTDLQLDSMIWQEVGENVMGAFVGLNNERMETFQSLEQARLREQELIASGRSVTMISKSFEAKTGAHFKIKAGKSLFPLSQADPTTAETIRQLIRPDHLYALHYLDTHKRDLPEVLGTWQDWAN